MEFRDVLARRRSVRSYDPRPVPRDVLERITNAAVVRAPSAGFSQGLRLVAVVTMGYPGGEAFPQRETSAFRERRKPRTEVVHWERWVNRA